MRLVAKKDEQGRVIGFDALDEQGSRIGGSEGLPGNIPVPPSELLSGGNYVGYRKDLAEQEAAEQRAARGESEEDDGGYYMPDTSEVNVPQTQSSTPSTNSSRPTTQPTRAQIISRREASYSQYSRDRLMRGNIFQQAIGRTAQLGEITDRAIRGTVDDVFDFGSAVVDVVRGVEINNDDNFLDKIGYTDGVSKATSNSAKLAEGLISLGVGTGAVQRGITAIPAIARLGRAAQAGTRLSQFAFNAGTGAAAGAVVDFVTAKQGEQNLSAVLQNTPLANPVSEFLAADKDTGYWETKVKATAEGALFGFGFDVVTDALGASLKRFMSEPLVKYLNGVKEAKALPSSEQREAMIKAAADADAVTESIGNEISSLLKTQTSDVVTESRRLLQGIIDGTEEAGLINAELGDLPLDDSLARTITVGGDVATPQRSLPPARPRPEDELLSKSRTQQELIEEQLLRLEDYKTFLNGFEDVDDAGSSLASQIDEVVFDLQDQLDEVITSRTALPSSRVIPEQGQPGVLVRDEFQPTPTREPNVVSGEGVGRVDDVNPTTRVSEDELSPSTQLDEVDAIRPTQSSSIDFNPELEVQPPRQPSTYRSKSQIRKAVAVKDVRAKNTRSPKQRIDKEVLNRKVRQSAGVSSNTNSDTADRFVNYEKLSSNKDMQEVIQEVLNTVPAKHITDSKTQNQIIKEAKALTKAMSELDDYEAESLFLAFAKNADNLPTSQTAARMVMVDMGAGLEDALKALPELGESAAKETTQQVMQRVGFLDVLSKYQSFSQYNKNLGKLAGQSLNIRGLDLSDDLVRDRIAKADYTDIFKKADTATESPNSIFERLLEASDSKEGRKKIAAMVDDMKSAKDFDGLLQAKNSGLHNILNAGRKTASFLQGVRMNGILSGSGTNLTNVVSNGTMSVYVPITQMAGAALDVAYHSMRGNKSAVRASKEAGLEAMYTLSALTNYLDDSIKLAAYTARKGKNVLEPATGSLEELQRLDLLNPESGNAGFDIIAKTLSLPTRFLATGDEFFKQMSYRANVHGRATVKGLEQGLKGKQLEQYINTTVANSLGGDVTNGVKGLGLDPESMEYARFVTFQTEVADEAVSTNRRRVVGLVEAMNKTPGLNILSNIFIPFIKTPANVMAYSARNTPLAAVSKQWRGDVAAGGARAARAKGEFALGSSALLGVIGLAMSGKLTGRAPKDPAKRKLWYEQGNQPYSIRFPNSPKSVSFQRLEPFASHFAVVADIKEAITESGSELTAQDMTSMMSAATIAFVESTKNRSFFEGLSQVTELINGLGDDREEGKLKSVFQNTLTTYILPYSSALNEQRKARDKVLRETSDLMDVLMNKVPGYSDDLPAKRSWLTGEPLTYQSNPILNIYPMSTQSDDPVIANLLKYNVQITPPRQSIEGVELSTQEYSRYLEITGKVEIGGKNLHTSLAETFDSFPTEALDQELDYLQDNDDYASKTPLAVEVRAVRSAYRKAAESRLLLEHPELFSKIQIARLRGEGVSEGLAGSDRGTDVWFMNESLVGPQQELPEEILEKQDNARVSTNKRLETLIEGPR